MYKLQNFLKHGLSFFLPIPKYVRQEFLQESVRKNKFSLWIICAIIFVVELFNIVRVLFWSPSGLGTRNNQLYFAMYCALILVAILWLVLQRALRQASAGRQWAAQYVVTSLLLLWHLGLNTYDLYRDAAAGTSVLTTALLALALLIQSPPCFSVVQFVTVYLLFRVIMAPLLTAGDRLNLTITFVVALAVSLAHAHHICVMLRQQKQILEMNATLEALAHQDPLTGLLNKTTVECRAEQILRRPEHAENAGGLTLFLVDLDEFKKINDHYGHPCGDHVLVETAEAIRRVFADATGLGRIGGDEFAVLYDHALTEAWAMALGHRLREQLREIQWQSQPIQVQCSVGVCICTRPQCKYPLLYAETDQMLYQAKEAGKGRCCVRQLTEEEPALEEAGA